MRRGRSFAMLAALAFSLLAFFLLRYPVRGFRVPMGPDSPVYMWWANLARLDGLSVANWRPGTPALTLMLGGVTGRTQLQIVAGLGGALGAAVGMASASLVRRSTTAPTWVWWLTGLLAGTWAVHLAGGYFGNLVFAVEFLAAIALLARAGDRGTVAATLLLGAGGLAHPMFFAVGVVILLLGLLLTKRRDARSRLWMSAVGGSAITGLGLLAMIVGPRPLPVDTSADAFMRRAGFGAELRAAYLERFRHHWARYVPWLSLPFAWVGRRETDEPARTALNAWVVVALFGLAVSLVTQVVPGIRLVAFAFAIPILAGLGLARTTRSVRRRWLAVAVVVISAGAMVVTAGLTWSRERPYADLIVLDRIEAANRNLAGVPAGTPLIFTVDEPVADDLMPFRATNTGNLLRAYLPADRIADMHLFVGEAGDLIDGRPTLVGDPLHDALSRRSLADLGGLDPAGTRVFVLTSRHASVDTPGVTSLLTDDVMPGDVDLPSPWSLVSAGVLTLVLLTLVGAGWARTAVTDGVDAVALAPAFGAATMILVGVVLDRFGVRLTSGVSAWAAVASGAAGYAVWAVGRTRPQPAGLED